MKKRGFTLIELLAVIIVLSILALIATPIIMNIIENTKKEAAERSMANIEHAAELYYYNNNNSETIFVCKDGVCSNGDTNLDIEGSIPDSGRIKIDNDGNVTLNSIEINEYVCYKEENYTCEKANKESNTVTNGVITLEESKSDFLSNYIIKGNSYQETRSGINLLNNYDIKEASSTPGSLTGATITDEYIEFVRQHTYDYANIPISLEGGKTYTLWYEYEIYDRSPDGTGKTAIGMGFSNEQTKQAYYYQNQIDQRIFTYTPTEDIDDLYVRVNANYGSDTPGKVRFRIMLLEGEYTLDTIPEYEPYGAMPSPEFPSEIQSVGDLVIDEKDPNYGKYEIPIKVTGEKDFTTSIYLDEPLRCISDNCDYIDYENNQIVRYIKRKELTGKETWKIYSSSNVFQTPSGDEITGSTNVNRVLSTHYIGNSWATIYNNTTLIGVSRSSNQIRIRPYEVCNTDEALTNWRNYLIQKYAENNPVVVEYVLATPTYEELYLPDIKLNKGTSNITIDTTIKPSEFVVDYYN